MTDPDRVREATERAERGNLEKEGEKLARQGKLFVRERFAGLFITHSVYEAVFLSTRVLVMSARPGRVIAEFAVPFPYPRPTEFRFDPEFARLTGQVSHALRDAHA